MKISHVITLAAVFFIVGCTPYVGQKPVQNEAVSENAVKQTAIRPVESAQVQPVEKSSMTLIDSLNNGNEIALSESDFAPQTETKSGKNNQTTVQSAVQSEVVLKYRVQVSAASKPDKLMEDKKKLEKLIEDSVFINKESAYYKLYAGEFDNKSDAEPLLQKLKKLGYTDSWISISRNSVKK